MFAFSVCYYTSFCQNFNLLKDVNNIANSSPYGWPAFVVKDEVVYFGLKNPLGLWRSDGSVTGTYQIKPNVSVTDAVAVNNKIFFSTSDALGLWISDGTESGTVPVLKELPAGIATFAPANLVPYNGLIYFSITGNSNCDQLWKSDGTVEGTQLVKDFYDLSQTYTSLNIRRVMSVNGRLFFGITSFDQNFNFESKLWVSNGTNVGTYKVTDNIPDPMIVVKGVGDSVYFTARSSSSSAARLWVSSGEENDAHLVAGFDKKTFSNTTAIFNSGDALFFTCSNDTSDERGLYKYDIGPGKLLTTIKEGSVNNLSKVNNLLLFDFYVESPRKNQLWKSDGSSIGTSLLKDSITVIDFCGANSNIYFSANDGKTGLELWETDGTGPGTKLVKDINYGKKNSDPSFITAFNQGAFFAANNGINGWELWRSDGTESGTNLVKDINTGITASANPSSITAVGNSVYFVVEPGTGGYKELYVSDGTGYGTKLTKEGVEPYVSIYGLPIQGLNDKTYFFGTDSAGFALYESNGTSHGTLPVKRIDTADYSLRFIGKSQGLLYMSRVDDNTGLYELWRSDGSEQGTFVIKKNIINLGEVLAIGDKFFIAIENSLWVTEGTGENTNLVKNFDGGLRSFVNYNGQLYFALYNSAGEGIWATDGSTAGTIAVTNNCSDVDNLTVSNGTLFFMGISQENIQAGKELYKTNGTSGSTQLVKDIAAGNSSSKCISLKNVNDLLYFFADDNIHSWALWRSDGSFDGTKFVSNNLMVKSWIPAEMYSVDSTVYLFCPDNTFWQSDGTTAGTIEVKDKNLDGLKYDFNSLNVFHSAVATGKQLFFAASADQYATELFVSGAAKIYSPDSIPFCPPLASGSLRTDIISSKYQWQISGSTGFENIENINYFREANTSTLQLINLPSFYRGFQFRCKVDNGYSNLYTITFKSSWNETVSNAWENPINWDCGTLPDANTDVVIAQGAVSVNSNVSVKSLTLKPGASVTVKPGYILLINGK